MSDLQSQFDEAVAASKQLSKKPDNDTLLKIYSLYKQATVGDVSGKKPGRFAMVDRAKYEAWEGVKGVSADDARQQYVDLIARLKG